MTSRGSGKHMSSIQEYTSKQQMLGSVLDQTVMHTPGRRALLNSASRASNRACYGKNGLSSQRSSSRLFNNNNDSEHDSSASASIEDFRFALTEMYEHKIGNYNEDIPSASYNKHEDILRHIQNRHNSLLLDSVVSANDSITLHDDNVCGDECEDQQCAIPDDFKILPDSQPIDVMAFLGIRRAEPLRVESKGEWQAWD